MDIIIHKTINQEFLKEWQTLWENSPVANYTNAPAWFISVLEAYHFTDYVIIALYKKKELVAVAALVKEKRYGMTVYTVAPTDFVCGIPFLIDISDKDVMNLLKKELASLGTVICTNIPDVFIHAIQSNNISASYEAKNYYLEITTDDKGGVAIPNKKKLLQRAKPLADKLEMKSFSGLESNALDIVFGIDKNSNKNIHGYNAFSDKQTIVFYRLLAEKFQQYLSLHVLYYDKKPIAYQLGFLVGKTFFCSQKAFVKDYRPFSIGRVLIIKMIEYFSKIEVNKIDFGSGEDEMKQSLTKLQRPLYSFIISQNNIIRSYLVFIGKTRNVLYHQIHKHKKAYAAFRKTRNIFVS